jgi:MOSC domain-containing protein YiiM
VVLSVNLADVREIEWRGQRVRTGIWKLPADGPVQAGPMGLEGDVQADRSVHGGVDMAIYVYAREEIDWWEAELGRPLEDGIFGENLTVRDVDVSGALVGERWRVGQALCEVSQPRIPCFKLGKRMDDPRFLKRFAQARRPGAYLRVLEGGAIGAGDAIEVLERPGHDVTVRLVAEAILHDHALAARLLAADALPETVRSWAAQAA